MDGVTMLLKSMGLDPAKMKADLEAAMRVLKSKVDSVESANARIESKLDYLIENRDGGQSYQSWQAQRQTSKQQSPNGPLRLQA